MWKLARCATFLGFRKGKGKYCCSVLYAHRDSSSIKLLTIKQIGSKWPDAIQGTHSGGGFLEGQAWILKDTQTLSGQSYTSSRDSDHAGQHEWKLLSNNIKSPPPQFPLLFESHSQFLSMANATTTHRHRKIPAEARFDSPFPNLAPFRGVRL